MYSIPLLTCALVVLGQFPGGRSDDNNNGTNCLFQLGQQMNEMAERLTPDSDFCARCPDGWTYFKGSCYTFVNELTKSWADAELYCDMEGSYLATLETAMEQQFLHNTVMQLAKSGSTNFYWLGATDTELEGTFVWQATGQEVHDTGVHWYSGQPNGGFLENCGCLLGEKGYSFHDLKCDSNGFFVCETLLSEPQESLEHR